MVLVGEKREAVLERLLPLGVGVRGGVVTFADILREQGHPHLLPFASDPFGNLFCFRYEGAAVSDVVFWDHETAGTMPVCKTFSELLKALHLPG